jgi:hypothetical protein
LLVFAINALVALISPLRPKIEKIAAESKSESDADMEAA